MNIPASEPRKTEYLLTDKEVAARLRISRCQVWHLTRIGTLTKISISGTRMARWKLSEVEAIINGERQKPDACAEAIARAEAMDKAAAKSKRIRQARKDKTLESIVRDERGVW